MNGAKYRDSQTKEFSKNLLPSGLLLKNGWRKFSKWKEMVAEEGLEFRKEKKMLEWVKTGVNIWGCPF